MIIINLTSSTGLFQHIKEKFCYVCPDIAKEFRKYESDVEKWVRNYTGILK